MHLRQTFLFEDDHGIADRGTPSDFSGEHGSLLIGELRNHESERAIISKRVDRFGLKRDIFSLRLTRKKTKSPRGGKVLPSSAGRGSGRQLMREAEEKERERSDFPASLGKLSIINRR